MSSGALGTLRTRLFTVFCMFISSDRQYLTLHERGRQSVQFRWAPRSNQKQTNALLYIVPFIFVQQNRILTKQMSRPFFIELYNSTDNSFLNKFKFVLQGTTVKDIKKLIIEKLTAKNHIQADEAVTIKDNDEYELGSDDEINDVIPDGKVKLYVSRKAHKPEPKVEDSKPQSGPVQSQALTSSPQPAVPLEAKSSQNVTQAQQQPKLDEQINPNTTHMDLSTLQVPTIEKDYQGSVLTVVCPQIRKSAIQIPTEPHFQNYYEFSSFVVKKLNLSPDLKAILYTQSGVPFIFNLDLLLTPFPKLDWTQTYSIVFTKTPSTCDSLPVSPMQSQTNLTSIRIKKQSALVPLEIKFEVDLNNTVAVLKHRVFELTRVHPLNQILKFGPTALTNDHEVLSTYGLKEDSILQLSFKATSNIVPASLCDKFYYRDVKLLNEQSELSVENFRSHMIVMAAHIKQEDRSKFLFVLERYSKNMPLVYAFKTLLEGVFLPQAARIALEEGMFGCILEFLKSLQTTPPNIKVQDAFLYLRQFVGMILHSMKSLNKVAETTNKYHACINIQDTCTFTLKTIKNPRYVKIDDGQTILVDRDEMHEQIDKGFTFDYYKKPKKDDLKTSSELMSIWEIFLSNHLDNSGFTMVYWIGRSENQADCGALDVELPDLSKATIDQYTSNIDTYTNLELNGPMQIKNKVHSYLLLKTPENRVRVYVSKNKDISKPYNIFDPIKGAEEAVNLDLLSGATRTENTEVPIDIKELKPVITRQPQEAIVVLFDISGSMSCKYFNEPDLVRIGAVKSFFEAFAYRTIAYNLEHVVSLIFFDNKIEVQCDFTEAIYDFNRLISDAKPRGSTRLYDTIIQAADQLGAFSVKYPECKLRILALTDGEDTASKSSYVDAAKAVVAKKIVMDSFAVGASCEGLKNVTLATGGKCYLTRSLEESLKLFEQETVLSVRNRSEEDLKPNLPVEELLEKAKYKPFDEVNGVHKFKVPTVKASSTSRKDLVKKLESEEETKKMAGNGALKRISKEIQEYMKDPHPFVSIYPCEDIHMWKILLLGPKDTPYENGLFLLFAKFPQDYPFRAPEVRFVTPIYHCNMNSQGRICHSVFDRNYSPALKFKNIVECVYGLILTPEPEDPLDNVVASFYLSDYQVYLKNAKEATAKNASLPSDKIVEELYGNITDDIEKQKKIKEVEDWIAEAKTHN